MTAAKAEIKYCLPPNAIRKVAIDAIAIDPAAPPSTLSKKLMEVHIPTIYRKEMSASRAPEPVGFPAVSFEVNIHAVKTPAID